MNFFNKRKVCPSKAGAQKSGCVCRCKVYGEMDCVTRSLFDEDFPTSNSLVTSVGHPVRGLRQTVNCDIECKADGSVVASVKPELNPVRFFRLSGMLQGLNGKKVGSVTGAFADVPKLPGFRGHVTASTQNERCCVMTEYRHPVFSVVSENKFMDNRDVSFDLNAAVRHKATGFAVGADAKVDAKNTGDKESWLKKYKFGMSALDARVAFARGPWNVLAECKGFDRALSVSVAKTVFIPYFTKEMLVGARLSARARKAEFSEGDGLKEKLSAVNSAVQPVLTLAARTRVTESSTVKVKINTSGAVGISFSEQLSKWAHAVFALNVNAKNLTAVKQNMLNFTLTIAN